MVYWYYGTTREGNKNDAVSTVPGKMGSKNYVTAVAATDAAHARVEAGKIFEGLKEDYGYDKALGKLYSASGICKCIAEFNEPVAQMSKA